MISLSYDLFSDFLIKKDIISTPIAKLKEEKIRSLIDDFNLWKERNNKKDLIHFNDDVFKTWLTSHDFNVEGVSERIPYVNLSNRNKADKLSFLNIDNDFDEYIDIDETETIKEVSSEAKEELMEELFSRRLNFLKQWLNSSNKIILPKKIRDIIKNKNLSNDQLFFIKTLPWWSDSSSDPLTYTDAEKYLNDNHYGLDKVKKDILNYVILKSQPQNQNDGLILLLNGPAGVGKTSIAKSIAKVLGKKFQVIKLGGMSSSADLDGHDKNWKTPGPGAIAKAIKESGSFAPVILLDEIDKIGTSKEHGTPHDALLFILDSDNTSVVDNYLEIPIDLSKIFFIATCNDKSKIDPILLDRMEIMDIRAYDQQEKKQIAKKYSLKKMITAYGLNGYLEVSDDVIEEIIKLYSIEPGVRNLNRYLKKICQYAQVQKARGIGHCIVKRQDLRSIIGEPIVGRSRILADNIVGNAYALDFDGNQGDVRCIQVSALYGNGQLICTGPISDSVKDSIKVVLSHIKRYAYKYKIAIKYFQKTDFHINFTGNKPYDGYDFGFAIALALLSAIYGKPIPNQIALIGELTLDGSITNVSNMPERIASAISKDGIKRVFVPKTEEEEKSYSSLVGIDRIKIIEIDKLQDLIPIFTGEKQ